MTTAIISFLIPFLVIFISPLLLLSCNQRTPQQKIQAEQQETQTTEVGDYEKLLSQYRKGKKQAAPPKVENPVFTEWKSMRARRVPEGTKVRWRLRVWLVSTNYYVARLEGSRNYEVICPRGLLIGEGKPDERVFKTMSPAEGDWVEVQGRFDGVTSSGRVRLDPDDFTNLGPRY